MRLARVGLFALLGTVGCLRFGYDALGEIDRKPDASREDAGTSRGEAGVATDSGRGEPEPRDAAMPDAVTSDANVREDASRPVDGAVSDGEVLDAVVSDAEPSDAGGMDASGGHPDGGMADPCPDLPSALFCDGFEDLAFERWSQPIVSNGAVERTTEPVYSGEGALRATTSSAGTTTEARLLAEVFDNQQSGDIWLRYYYFLPEEAVINTSIVSATIAQTEDPYFDVSLSIRPAGIDIIAGNAFYRRSEVFPRDVWTCVELHVEIATAGVFEAFLDGVNVVRTPPMTDTLPDTGYTSFAVGVHHLDSGQGPIEAFVDDVVAGTTRMGCD